MKLELTRRGSYAIRAAVALARIGDGQLTTASTIAAAMGIPPRFLPQVMGDLVRAGLVEGIVGRGGGSWWCWWSRALLLSRSRVGAGTLPSPRRGPRGIARALGPFGRWR